MSTELLFPEARQSLERPVVAFTVYGTPQQRGSKKAVPVGKRGGGYLHDANGRPLVSVMDDNKNSKAWMRTVEAAAIRAYGLGQVIASPIELCVRFYFRRPQCHYGTGRNAGKLKASAPKVHAQSPDLAKLLRAIEDAITGHVWLDDRLVCRYTGDTGRYWTSGEERAEVEIYCPEGVVKCDRPLPKKLRKKRSPAPTAKPSEKPCRTGATQSLPKSFTRTKRGPAHGGVLSPVRWTSGRRFLAICLCRCEPREFNITQVESVRLRRAADYVMPVAIVELP